jgi:hypothetical protein
MDIQILDWIQYVGDVTTEYEANFLRNFGGFLCASHSSMLSEQEIREKILECLDELISDSVSDARKREIVAELRSKQGES